MKFFVRKIIIILVILLFISAFSSSYNTLSIDKLAYVVAIGIDKSNKDTFSFSFQFTNVTSPSESGSAEKSPSIVNSVDASSISSAINLMNTYIGKRLNLSHCKVIVFSEEVAMEGISNEIYTLMNDTQIRPSANIVISKCNAKYYIENSKPILENLITKYYDIFPTSSNYTGFTANVTIGDFFNQLECKTCDPTAILGGMNTENAEISPDSNQDKGSYSKSNESTITGKRGSENIGLAVFKDDKLVGELNAIECLSYLNIKNDVKSFYLSVPSYENAEASIDLYMTANNKNKITVDIINGSPYIKFKGSYSARIYSIDQNAKFLDGSVLSDISNSCNKYLESIILDYLYKTSRDFNADINEFGKYALCKFGTIQEFNDFNWLDNYKNAVFDVEIDTNVESSILITET